MPPAAVHVVMPAAVDDPARPSGGNRYDRRICDELRALGWTVHEHLVPGSWPHPTPSDVAGLETALRADRDGRPDSTEHDVFLVDGIVASAAGAAVARAAETSPVVALVHMPFGPIAPALGSSEALMLRSVAAVAVPSLWTAQFLLREYGIDQTRISVVSPGVDAAARSTPRADGGRIVCIGAVTRGKGHDVLVGALADVASRPGLADIAWRCTCIGATDIEPDFVAALIRMMPAGLAQRIDFAGPMTAVGVARALAAADLAVLPSRAETWGMVVTEALARGIPVVASDVGGVPESLGLADDGSRPGILVPAGDRHALADALQRWLTDGDERAQLRQSALHRRARLGRWSQSASQLADVLSGARAQWSEARNSTAAREVSVVGAFPLAPGTPAALEIQPWRCRR